MDYEIIMPYRDGLAVFVVADDNGNRRMGYIDENQVVRIPPVYYVRVNLPDGRTVINPNGDFKNHLASIMTSEGKFGLIDTEGKTVLEPRYDALSNVIVNDIVFFREGTTCGFMKTNGLVLAKYPDCTVMQQTEGFVTRIEYDGGKKKTEIDLSLL